jgi:hypothetical protein
MLSLIILQRVAVGKAWAGKTIDCAILHPDSRPDTRHHEEVSTMGFNPNTELSCGQNDYTLDDYHSATKGQHDLTMEMREVLRSKG